MVYCPNDILFEFQDFGYHSVTSVLLITAAAIYIVSAIQIREFSGGVDIPLLNFRTEEKFVAGVNLAICVKIQSFTNATWLIIWNNNNALISGVIGLDNFSIRFVRCYVDSHWEM